VENFEFEIPKFLKTFGFVGLFVLQGVHPEAKTVDRTTNLKIRALYSIIYHRRK
jgi:hypothetical protein